MVRDGHRPLRARATAALAGLAGFALWAPAVADGATTVEPGLTAAEVREYWTPERMENAIPPGPLGGEATAARGGTLATRVRQVTERPKRTHGKVFFRLSGVDYVCSATSVDSPSGSLVWTAGHCVYEPGSLGGGTFASHWEFVPAYKGGDAPFGEWPAQKLNATAQWENSGGLGCVPTVTFCGNPSFDLGAASVFERGGKTLRQVVGSRDIVFGGARELTYKAFGYPAAGQFNGQRMFRCTSPYLGADSGDEPKPMRIACDMTGGSSGGGWVSGGAVRSVISYGYADEPNRLYGPYQGAAAQSLYDSLKNG
jgi:hypothetical protein